MQAGGWLSNGCSAITLQQAYQQVCTHHHVLPPRRCCALCSSHPGVAKVAFTGSVATGRRVYAAAAGNLRPATMELGGKSGE